MARVCPKAPRRALPAEQLLEGAAHARGADRDVVEPGERAAARGGDEAQRAGVTHGAGGEHEAEAALAVDARRADRPAVERDPHARRAVRGLPGGVRRHAAGDATLDHEALAV